MVLAQVKQYSMTLRNLVKNRHAIKEIDQVTYKVLDLITRQINGNQSDTQTSYPQMSCDAHKPLAGMG